MQPANPIFCAIDTADLDRAQSLARAVTPHVGGLKLGLEFFCAHGPAGLVRMAGLGLPIFADLKLHDIPNTVAGALKAIMPAAPALVTIHTAGGRAMMRAAAEAAAQAAETAGVARPRLVGVTVLTSLDAGDLGDMGVAGAPEDQVQRLAGLAHAAGLDGVVCSPAEVGTLRSAFQRPFTLVVPGVRPAGSAAGDQKRIATPEDARVQGADILVIGRPITEAPDPGAAAAAIADSLTAHRGAHGA